MSQLLEAAIGAERRLECARNDAALIASLTPNCGKVVIADRGPAQPESGDSFDLAVEAIEAGAQRVQVAPQAYGCPCYLCGTPRENLRSAWCSWCDGGKARGEA